MIKLGIHLIVKKHDYAPEIFKKFLLKLIEFLSNNFKIIIDIKIFSYTISLLEYFFKILFFLKILNYSGDFL
jgi:hypothetical protein